MSRCGDKRCRHEGMRERRDGGISYEGIRDVGMKGWRKAGCRDEGIGRLEFIRDGVEACS